MSLIDQIISVESGGNPNARNSRSSASGPGQFIDSTWLSTIKAHRPDIAAGKSDADLLALKSDPDLSRQMTTAYAADNSATLARAGLPVTAGTTYLAHFSGPQGAVSVLKAAPSTPVSDILGPAAVKANPFLKDMTAGDLQKWADRKMGGASADLPPTRVTIPAQAPPIFPPEITQAVVQPEQKQQAAPVGRQMPQIDQPITPPAMPALQQPNLQSLMARLQPLAPAPPIIPPERKPIDLSRLQAAFRAPGNRGFFIA